VQRRGRCHRSRPAGNQQKRESELSEHATSLNKFKASSNDPFYARA
jgi:hypothetical protein